MANLNRRQALSGAATAGFGIPLLAACGADDSSDASGTTTVSASPDGGNTPTASSEGATAGSSSTAASSSTAGLVAAADVPVGGGVVLSDAEIVVTQPTDGDFKAFTAVCTHSGCLVSSVEDAEIVCACHGSHFSITDGSVTAGPAPSPLAAVDVSVEGGEVVQG